MQNELFLREAGMPIAIETLPNEAIIISTFHGEIVVADVVQMFEQTVAFSKKVGRKVYRINDMRQITMSFRDVLTVIREAGDNVAGSITDEQVQIVFVGTNATVKLIHDMIEAQGATIPVFQTLEDALFYVRTVQK